MFGSNGPEYVLATEGVKAVVTGVGAALRVLRVHGTDIVARYPADAPRPAASGLVLAPWPNRVRDGRWTDAQGAVQQLDITEVPRGNASHGLLRYTEYRGTQPDAASLELAATLYPQHGYPYLLETSVRYRLVDDGVEVEHRARNLGSVAAPFALGIHPFVTIDGVPPAELVVTGSSEHVYEVDAQMIPTAVHPVQGRAEDLRAGRPLSELELDHGFRQTAPGPDGRFGYHLTAPDGRRVDVWGDDAFRWWQLYTTTNYPGQEKALAIEPMTAPTDAFNSGEGLVHLEPGAEWSAVWGIRASGFTAA